MGYVYISLMVILTTIGQLLTKKGSQELAWEKGFRVLFNRYLIMAGLLIFFAPVFYILALRTVELSTAFAFTGLNYILVGLGGKLFLKEELNRFHYWGMVSIFLGLTIFGL